MLRDLSIRPGLFFALLAAVSVLSFGVDLESHQFYNLSELALINGGSFTDDGFFGYDHSLFNPLLYYIKYVVPVLEYGLVYITFSAVIKFCTLIAGYNVIKWFVDNDIAMIVTTIFFLAYLPPSHGVAVNGLWLAPGFFPASLSALATLVSIRMFSKGSYLHSGLMSGVSIFFHANYGITAIAFLFLGFLGILRRRSVQQFWTNLATLVLPMIVVIGYIAYFRSNTGIDVEFTHGIDEWFRFAYSTDPADVSLLWTVREYGYGLIPLMFLGAYMAYQEEIKGGLQLVTLGSVALFIVYILVEIAHRSGIFFGSISEIFVATQLRRGVWIVALFSTIQIAKSLYEIRSDIFNNKIYIVLLAFAISLYLIPSVLGVAIVVSSLTALRVHPVPILWWMATVLMIALYGLGEGFDLAWQAKLFAYNALFMMGVFVLLMGMRYGQNDRYMAFATAVLSTIVIAYTGQGIVNDRLADNISVLASNGVMSKTETGVISNAIGYFRYDGTADRCMRQRSNVIPDQKIVLPVTGARNTRNGLFSAYGQVFGYYNPMYSRKDYELSLLSLKSIIGAEVVDSFFDRNTYFNKSEMDRYFLSAYFNLPMGQLRSLRDGVGLRFYLVDIVRNDLDNAFVCKGDHYYVYDLTSL